MKPPAPGPRINPVDTLRHRTLPANPSSDALAAVAVGLAAGLSLGDAWPPLRWLLLVLCGY
ncbi:MAG TPA: hypothetical protein VN787_02265 [Steroidobacteraceae bacterium]|nr:hypothetical protein [Steroidobacteraceae bacterium]